MNKYKIKDEVYCVDIYHQRIEHGTIQRIIIEADKISYGVAPIDCANFITVIVEEKLMGKTIEEVYQQLRDNIEEYFPLTKR